MDPWDTLGTQSDMLKTLKVSLPHRDMLRTLRHTLGTLKVPQPHRDMLGTLKCHGPVGHIGVPKDVTAPEGHSGDPKGVVDPWHTLGTQKVSQSQGMCWGSKGTQRGLEGTLGIQRDTLGTLKVLWTHGTHRGPKATCWEPKKCHSPIGTHWGP